MEQVVYGKRATLNAEFGTPAFYAGVYLVQPIGNGEWDAEGFATLAAARAQAKDIAKAYGVPAVRVR